MDVTLLIFIHMVYLQKMNKVAPSNLYKYYYLLRLKAFLPSILKSQIVSMKTSLHNDVNLWLVYPLFYA